MFRLDEFRYDGQIEADEVYVVLDGALEPMLRDDAIELAHRQGANLVAAFPGDDELPSCNIAPVAEPVHWEAVAFDSAAEPDIDEDLWFTGVCEGRDYLISQNGHTFPGRMSARCPVRKVSFNVSLSEMEDMSREARYFVQGFLAGAEPDLPYDDEGDLDPDDLQAWRAATARFNRTGSWYGRWGTCRVCGCVLLPDLAGNRCEAHRESGAD